jgi:hypothetical protein
VEAAIEEPKEALGPSERKGAVEVEVRTSCDPDHWNEQVCAYPEGCFYDTTMRHEVFLRIYADAQPFYMTAYKDGREVGWLGFLETYFGHDIITWQKRWRPMRFMLKYGMKTFDAFTLPMVHDEGVEAEVVEAFVDALDDLARKRGVYKLTHFKYPPPGREPALAEAFFTTRSFQVLRHGTYLIDLSADLDLLWSKVKSEARTAVRKAGKQGISVRPGGSEEDIVRYYELFVQNRNRDATKNMPRPLYSQESIADHVRYFAERDMQQLFCAEIDGRIESCTLVKYYNGIATFNSHSRSDICYERNLRDGDLLCWEMIKWAKGRGFRYFDMTGFDVDPRNDRQRGIRRFKSKWGGECVYYNYYSKVYGSRRDGLLSLARRVVSRLVSQA